MMTDSKSECVSQLQAGMAATKVAAESKAKKCAEEENEMFKEISLQELTSCPKPFATPF